MIKSIKILLVEDDEGIREELVSFLRRFTKDGLYVAEDGEEGLELFRKHLPDMIISDIKIPKMTGIEMVKRIRKEDPDIPILFTTAHSDIAYFLEAIELQVNGYLLKPIKLKQLHSKIKRISEDLTIRRKYEFQKIIMNEIAYLQGSLLAVFDKTYSILFLNDAGLTFLGVDSIEKALEENTMISERMVEVDGYFYPSDIEGRGWISEILTREEHKRIIAIRSLDKKFVYTYMVKITYIEETQHTIVALSEVTEIEAERISYQKRAYIDKLTQAYNREMFDKTLKIAVKKALDEESELSIILLDIDYFKRINDKYGHMTGDKVLIGISNLIKNNIRKNDFFARWGGEEFILLLPDTGLGDARNLAECLRKRIESHIFHQGISLTSSFGVSTLGGRRDLCLFEEADKAVYEAKLQGRNRVNICEDIPL